MLTEKKRKFLWCVFFQLTVLLLFSGVVSGITPNPMTWETTPYANGAFLISMKATTASDPSGVEYYFTCTSGGGHDSGWQDSPLYEDRILKPDTTYTYTVKARDKSILPTETTPSTAESATTDYSEFGGPVVGYIPPYRTISTTLDYKSLTHINLFSLGADTSGNLLDYTSQAELPVYVANAHANNVKVYVTCTGSYNDLVQNSTALANFISQLIQFCLNRNLDGVDIDWEDPYGLSSAERENYSLFVKALDEALSPYDLGLTIAGAIWYYDVNPWALKHLDWINIMAYDMGKPDHSTFQDALDALAFWENYGVSRHKLLLGVPFYGYGPDNNQYTYAQIYDWYQPGPDIDSIGGYYFNGINTIKQKTDYAFTNNYGGVMIWEVGQDKLNHPASLLAPLTSTAKRYAMPNPSLPPEQVAYWSLDETTGTTALDGNGNGLDGTVTNTDFDTASVPGPVGTAMQFDGTDDYIAVLNSPLLNPRDAITVSAWIKADTWQTDIWAGSIVSKDEWNGDSGGYVLRCGENGRLSFAIALDGIWAEVSSTSLMSTGTWYHVAGTYDGSTMKIYIDGSEVASVPATGSITLSTYPLNIGRGAYATSRIFDGAIDEVRIYNDALDSTGIQALFQGGRSENPTPEKNAVNVISPYIGWVGVGSATGYDVYFGTDLVAVENSTQASDEYQGSTTETTYDVSPLSPSTQYYWRIDTVTSSQTIAGEVWAFTTASEVDVSQGLTAHFTMDTDDISGSILSDLSGDPEYNGVIVGSSSYPAGQIAEALDFDDVDDYVNVTGIPTPADALTVSAWINADTWRTNYWEGTIVSTEEWDGASGGYVLRCGENGRLSFALVLSSGWAEVATGQVMSADTWYHVVGTYDGSSVKLYINGSEVASSQQAGSIVAGSYPLNIGRGTYATDRVFDGQIDDVAIWQRALDSTEVEFIYIEGAAGRSFDEPLDTTPPAAPTGLTATPSDGSVSLDWSGNSETDLAGYNVYRDTTSGLPYIQISSDVTASDYVDNTVTNGTTYYYIVTAIDSSNNESDNSNEASATPQTAPDADPPTPNPATFALVPAAISDAEITMTATTGTDASGPIEYLFTETSGSPGGTSSGWQTSPTFTDTGLMASTQYTYTVTMRDALGNSGTASAPASATTDSAPSAVIYVQAIDLSVIAAGGPNRKGVASITIVDQNSQPVSGATVYGDYTGSYSESGSAVTNSSGVAVIETVDKAKNPSFTFTVTNVTVSGYTYDPASNVETSDSY